MIRISGDTIELTPPLIISESQIGEVIARREATRQSRAAALYAHWDAPQ